MHDKTNKMICAPSENPGQSGHPPSLIRVFAGRMKNHPKSAQRRLWSDWADAQADLTQLLCWFCRAATQIKRLYNTIISTRPPTFRCQFYFSHLCYSNPYVRTHTHACTHAYSRANFSSRANFLCKCSKWVNLSGNWHFESKNKM